MGSSASVMKSSKLTKPDDCPQENWKEILQLFDNCFNSSFAFLCLF